MQNIDVSTITQHGSGTTKEEELNAKNRQEEGEQCAALLLPVGESSASS